MPLYDYRCAQCGKVSEIRHGFNESHGGLCPACGGALSRVYNPAPIVFKGSGFYVTDSRRGSSSSPTEAAKSAGPAGPKVDATKTEAPGSAAAGDAKSSEPAA